MNINVRPLKKIQSSKSFSRTNLKPKFYKRIYPKTNGTDEKTSKRESLRKSYEELVKLIEFDNDTLEISKLRDRISILIDEDNTRKLNIFLKKTFNLFDYQKIGKIDVESIKDCLYALNLCPTEDELDRLLKALNGFCEEKNKTQKQIQQTQGHNQKKTGKFLREAVSVTTVQQHKQPQDIEKKITFDEFSTILLSILMCNKYKCASFDALYDAFKALDENNNGFILWSNLEDFVMTRGEKFNEEELQNMKEYMNISNNNDKVYYNNLVSSLQVDLEIPKLYRLKSEKETEQEIVESFFGLEMFN